MKTELALLWARQIVYVSLLILIKLAARARSHFCAHEIVVADHESTRSHEMSYTAHPFEATQRAWEAGISEHSGNLNEPSQASPRTSLNKRRLPPRRLLQDQTSDGSHWDKSKYKRFRIKFHLEVNATLGESPSDQWLREVLIPKAVQIYEDALTVVPANDFSPDSEDLTRCGASEEKASSLSSNGITDADFYVVITTELAGLCAGSGEGGETACAMDECRSASDQCSNSHRICGVAAPMCTDEASCTAAQTACTLSIGVCMQASAACQLALLTCKSSADAIAWASTCKRDQYDRPIMGRINLCPAIVPSAPVLAAWVRATQEDGALPEAARTLLHVMLHELAHALGFSAGSIGLFRDGDDGGVPRTPREQGRFTGPVDRDAAGTPFGVSESTIQVSTERGHSRCDPATDPSTCVYHLVTPAVVQAARNHFGCDSLKGAEIENQPSGKTALLGSHWEMRLFNGETMSSALMMEPFLSQVTLAFFHDSGWYRVPDAEAHADTARASGRGFWGYKQGCEFAQDSCLAPVEKIGELPTPSGSPSHFCNQMDDVGCTFDRRGLGKCLMQQMLVGLDGVPIQTEYAYFQGTAMPYMGGAVTAADYCPFYVPVQSCADIVAASSINSTKGEIYGEDSICITSTLASSNRTLRGGVSGACYQVECIPNERAMLVTGLGMGGELSTVRCEWYDSGSGVEMPGLNGLLVCPDVDSVCGSSGYCEGFYSSRMTTGVYITSIFLLCLLQAYTLVVTGLRHRSLGWHWMLHAELATWTLRHPSMPWGFHPLLGLVQSCVYHLKHSYVLQWPRPNVGSLQEGDVVKIALYEHPTKPVAGKMENLLQVRLMRADQSHELLTLPVGSAPLPASLRGWDYTKVSTYMYLYRVHELTRDAQGRPAMKLRMDGSSLFMLTMSQQRKPPPKPKKNVHGGVRSFDELQAEERETLREPESSLPPINLSDLDNVHDCTVQRRVLPAQGFASTENPLAGGGGAMPHGFGTVHDWDELFLTNHVVVPPLKELGESVRPAGAEPMGGAGRCGRRWGVVLLNQVLLLFFFATFEVSQQDAEKSSYCNSLHKEVMMRSVHAAIVNVGMQYLTATVGRNCPYFESNIELMHSRVFNIWYTVILVLALALDSTSFTLMYKAQRLWYGTAIWIWALFFEVLILWPILMLFSATVTRDFASEASRKEMEAQIQSGADQNQRQHSELNDPDNRETATALDDNPFRRQKPEGEVELEERQYDTSRNNEAEPPNEFVSAYS